MTKWHKFSEELPPDDIEEKQFEDYLLKKMEKTFVQDYENLVSYCKENKLETLHFFLDLIDCYTESAKSGIRKDNCVGHFLCVLEEVFPDTFESDGYVALKDIQKMWKYFATIILSVKHKL